MTHSCAEDSAHVLQTSFAFVTLQTDIVLQTSFAFVTLQTFIATATVQPMKAETRALWEQLFANFTLFDDLRSAKAMMGGNMVAIPDFRHKESEECLW